MKERFIRVPNQAVLSMKPGSLRLYAFLASYANPSTRECWPSHDTIKEQMPISTSQTITNYLQGMDEAFISIKHRYKSSNLYTLESVEDDYILTEFATATDPNLTNKDFMLYLYLASHYHAGDGHRVASEEDVRKKLNISRKVFDASLDRLLNQGYISMSPNDRGMKEFEYVVYLNNGHKHIGKVLRNKEMESFWNKYKTKFSNIPEGLKELSLSEDAIFIYLALMNERNNKSEVDAACKPILNMKKAVPNRFKTALKELKEANLVLFRYPPKMNYQYVIKEPVSVIGVEHES